MTPRQAAALGPLVADAASLGLHWIYDPDRLAAIAKQGPVAFREPDARDYAEVRGYFAHGGRRAGDLSGYGATAGLALLHLAAHDGRFDRLAYQQAWVKHFGPGGSFVGYIDKPTRGTLLRLMPIDKPADWPAQSGIDDDQMPALECAPALAASHRGDDASLDALIESAVMVTSVNALAVDGARVLARAVRRVFAGMSLPVALGTAAAGAGPVLQPLLTEALERPFDPVATAQRFGPACHMHQGLPVAFHILAHTRCFTEAVETNILAAGDSCGRSMAIGALAGAAFSGAEGIPASWLARVAGMARYAAAAEGLLGDR